MKQTLLKHLSDAGWEQAEVVTTTQWWGSEVWRVRSVTANWGFELFLAFMDDIHPGVPTSDSPWLVKLTAEDPCETTNPAPLGSIRTKQKYLLEELPAFLELMDRLRRDCIGL